MYRANVRPLLSAVAAAVNAVPALTGRVAIDRAAAGWLLDDGAYAIVTAVSPPAPVLRGDGRTLTRTTSAQVALVESEQAEDPALAEAVAAALDGVTVDGYRGVVLGAVRLPDPDTDEIRHAIEIRYPLVR